MRTRTSCALRPGARQRVVPGLGQLAAQGPDGPGRGAVARCRRACRRLLVQAGPLCAEQGVRRHQRPDERECPRGVGRQLEWLVLRSLRAKLGADGRRAVDRAPRRPRAVRSGRTRVLLVRGPEAAASELDGRLLQGLHRDVHRLLRPAAVPYHGRFRDPGRAHGRCLPGGWRAPRGRLASEPIRGPKTGLEPQRNPRADHVLRRPVQQGHRECAARPHEFLGQP
mmetsp:Transcript_72090/g.220694  ORF Transcript_72090/g.220694 Transcript_72090/m.220694 type:complete len:225 (-) Transcript_72090:570-1244(-)